MLQYICMCYVEPAAQTGTDSFSHYYSLAIFEEKSP